MLELSPRITFSPDKILELRRTLDPELKKESPIWNKKVEELSGLPGYSVTDTESDTIIQVKVDEVIDEPEEENEFYSPTALKLIQNLSLFTYFDYDDPREGVFSLDSWGTRGASGNIHAHFQRWLNAGGFSEDVASSALTAMALPYSQQTRERAKEDFLYQVNGRFVRAGLGGFDLGITNNFSDFGIALDVGEDDTPEYREGKTEWNWLNFTTIGNCACWGPDWTSRGDIYIRAWNNRLYDFGPHNVDTEVQSLSLVLGAARLAYHSAQYEGTEDILADVVWETTI